MLRRSVWYIASAELDSSYTHRNNGQIHHILGHYATGVNNIQTNYCKLLYDMKQIDLTLYYPLSHLCLLLCAFTKWTHTYVHTNCLQSTHVIRTCVHWPQAHYTKPTGLTVLAAAVLGALFLAAAFLRLPWTSIQPLLLLNLSSSDRYRCSVCTMSFSRSREECFGL